MKALSSIFPRLDLDTSRTCADQQEGLYAPAVPGGMHMIVDDSLALLAGVRLRPSLPAIHTNLPHSPSPHPPHSSGSPATWAACSRGGRTVRGRRSMNETRLFLQRSWPGLHPLTLAHLAALHHPLANPKTVGIALLLSLCILAHLPPIKSLSR